MVSFLEWFLNKALIVLVLLFLFLSFVVKMLWKVVLDTLSAAYALVIKYMAQIIFLLLIAALASIWV